MHINIICFGKIIFKWYDFYDLNFVLLWGAKHLIKVFKKILYLLKSTKNQIGNKAFQQSFDRVGIKYNTVGFTGL